MSASPSSLCVDPLLNCLLFLTRFFGKPQASDTLLSGLPLVEQKLTPKLFIRAAARADLAAQIQKKDLHSIKEIHLPVVLLLKDQSACVITSIQSDTSMAQMIVPETGDGTASIALDELKDSYTGYIIEAKPKYRFEDRAQHYHAPQPRSWFKDTLLRYRHTYLHIALATLVINLLTLVSTLYTMNIYDRVVPHHAIETLWALSWGVLLAYAFDFTLKILRGKLLDLCGKKTDAALASLLFQKAMDLKTEHTPQSVGSFSSLFHHYEMIREFFTSSTLVAFIDLPFALLFLAAMAYIHPLMAVPSFLAAPIIIACTFWLERSTRQQSSDQHFGNLQKSALLFESLNNLETIKILGLQGYKQSRFEQSVEESGNFQLHMKEKSAFIAHLCQFIMQSVSVANIIIGVYLVMQRDLTMGGIIATSILGGRVLAPLASLSSMMNRYHGVKLSLEGLDRFMSLPTERSEHQHFLYRPSIKGHIKLQNLSFAYPQSRVSTLSDINLEIQPKEKVALIGRIGSGKSTLFKILLGLYTPSQGQVLMDGTEIGQIDPAMLRRHMGHVSPDSHLFYGSLRENILMGRPWVDDETFLQICELSGVHHFATTHPQGYDMPLGEHGKHLSNGQRQSVLVARALITDPNILLLDEPTSSMDTMAERTLIRNLKQYSQDKTLFLVTHRLNLLELVDRIIILEQGRVVADGKRDTILEAFNLKRTSVEDA